MSIVENSLEEVKKEVLKAVKKEVLKRHASDLASELMATLGALETDTDELCYAIMVMHKLHPNAPMPEDMVKMLQKHGHNPNVRVATEEDTARLAVEGDCDCPKCQALRAKSQVAKPNPLVTSGQNTVH